MANGTTENQSAEVKTVSYEQMLELGHGLIIAKVPLTSLREQDINARIMKNEMQKQLTDNIRKRGQLESLPFCALVDGKIEIISGHHRIRSAKDSGVINEIYVILDVTGLTRSQIAAKQLAHNAISGFDDQSTLKEIVKLIDDVDDMLESYIGKDILGEPLAELENFCPRQSSTIGRILYLRSCRIKSKTLINLSKHYVHSNLILSALAI